MTVADEPCLSYRYKLSALAFFGFLSAMAVRVNFNIAFVAMVNLTAPAGTNATSDQCPQGDTPANTTPTEVLSNYVYFLAHAY